MKKVIISSLLLIYIIIYKFIFISYGELFQYIINPLIWIIFSIISYYILYLKNYPYFKDKKDVIYRVIYSSLLYVITFYSLGFIFGFSKNPYSISSNGLIINSFSILLVLGLKEFIRGILVNESKSNKIYKLFIFIIFLLSNLNITLILSTNNIIIIIGKYIIPVISTDIFCKYLVKKGSYISSAIYRLIIFIPTLIIPILPKFDWIIPTLFDTLVPIITYVSIEYVIGQKNKFVPNIKEEYKPRKWIPIFIITILIIIFTLGGFNIKPIVVVSSSMETYISPGDLLMIGKCNINDVDVSDVIQFKLNDYTVVHRVIKVRNNKDNIELITKGDNNNTEDKYPVTEDNLVGCLKYKVPYIGYPSYLVHKIFSTKEVEIETGK